MPYAATALTDAVDERPPLAGGALQRQQMLEELESLDRRLRGDGPDLSAMRDPVARRRALHAVEAVLQVLGDHPADDSGRCLRCRRRTVCPAGEVLRLYVAGWLATGGLAMRREGDPDRVSSRRLR